VTGDRERREAIGDFLQQLGAPDVDRPAILAGWVLATEWVDDNGDRWLARGWSPDMPKWHAHGLIHEVLYGSWADDQEPAE
jgi:hypothetical protein